MKDDIKEAVVVKDGQIECPHCGYRHKIDTTYTHIRSCANENCGKKIRVTKEKK